MASAADKPKLQVMNVLTNKKTLLVCMCLVTANPAHVCQHLSEDQRFGLEWRFGSCVYCRRSPHLFGVTGDDSFLKPPSRILSCPLQILVATLRYHLFLKRVQQIVRFEVPNKTRSLISTYCLHIMCSLESACYQTGKGNC